MPARTEWTQGSVSTGANSYFIQRTGSEADEVSSVDRKVEGEGQLKRLQRSLSNKASTIATIGFAEQVKAEFSETLLSSKLNLLLITFPFAIASKLAGWGDGPTFALCAIALIPLAERLGFVTEQLAMYTNDSLGGLLNATFGNATEVIISGFAIRDNLLRVVQLSLLGSVVSNLLLVLGSAFIAGGYRHPMQAFNQQGISVNCGLLVLSVVAILLPSLLASTHTGAKELSSELALSRFESLFLLVSYCLFLFFQLKTHRHLYEDDEEKSSAAPSRKAEGSNIELGELNNHASSSANQEDDDFEAQDGDRLLDSPVQGAADVKEEDDDDEDELVLSKVGCFVWLTVITICIALLSEYIVDAITGAAGELHIPLPFLATIVLPIVGNAAEHASAIIFAWKNRIEISLGVAVGSATQVGVLVIPFTVVLAWIMGRPLSMNFNAFEAVTYFISVLLAVVVVQDGHANWLKGVMLVVTFIFVSAGFWSHKDVCLSFDQLSGTAAHNSTTGCS